MLYQLRIDFSGEIGFGNEELLEYISVQGYLGKGRLTKNGQMSIFVGPAYFFTDKCKRECNEDFVGPAISGNIQVAFRKIVGFGIDLYAATNMDKNVASVRIIFMFGY